MWKKKKTDPNGKEMPFLDHLEELRWRLIRSLVTLGVTTLMAFPFTGHLLDLLTLPNDRLAHPAKLVFLKPTGMIMVRMELAFAAGLIVSLPFIFYQLWKFIAPGLLPHERRYVLPLIAYATGSFLMGALFCYFVMIPVVLPFLYNLGTESIEATININDYIGFLLRLILVSGAVFELPLLAYFLSRLGILSPDFLKKYRRYGIVIIFIVAAVITPPDPASQLLLAVPLVILYEISIWLSRLGYRRHMKKEAVETH